MRQAILVAYLLVCGLACHREAQPSGQRVIEVLPVRVLVTVPDMPEKAKIVAAMLRELKVVPDARVRFTGGKDGADVELNVAVESFPGTRRAFILHSSSRPSWRPQLLSYGGGPDLSFSDTRTGQWEQLPSAAGTSAARFRNESLEPFISAHRKTHSPWDVVHSEPLPGGAK